MKNPSDTPAYRRALKNLKAAIAELSETRDGKRGRPTHKYVQLMDTVAVIFFVRMLPDVRKAFLNTVRAREMRRQFNRAYRRVVGKLPA